MQVIIDQIINRALSVEKEMRPSAEMMRQIIAGAVDAVGEMLDKKERMRLEQGLQRPRGLGPDEEC